MFNNDELEQHLSEVANLVHFLIVVTRVSYFELIASYFDSCQSTS
jgi:hypothetical protein